MFKLFIPLNETRLRLSLGMRYFEDTTGLVVTPYEKRRKKSVYMYFLSVLHRFHMMWFFFRSVFVRSCSFSQVKWLIVCNNTIPYYTTKPNYPSHIKLCVCARALAKCGKLLISHLIRLKRNMDICIFVHYSCSDTRNERHDNDNNKKREGNRDTPIHH